MLRLNMNEIYFIFSLLFIGQTLSESSCVAPSLSNGLVNGTGDGHSFVGVFQCDPGYTLVGDSKLKCRNGQWSSKKRPVCTVIGKCDPNLLPNVDHAKKTSYKTRAFRDSVYKYHCHHGYTMFGHSLVHCTHRGWDTSRLPVCAKRGCDESQMSFIHHGVSKRKAHGSVYLFRCEDGTVMDGSRIVVCDGENWNSTAPACLVAPETVSLEGPSIVAQGEVNHFECTSSASNPKSELHWNVRNKNGEEMPRLLEISQSSSTWAGTGWKSSSTALLTADSGLVSLVLTCTATNAQLGISIQESKLISIYFAPEEITVFGPSKSRLGDTISFLCESSPSVPATTLRWTVSRSGALVETEEEEEELRDESFITRSNLQVEVREAGDMEVICYGNNPAMRRDRLEFSHIVEIISPPGVPTISGISPDSPIQNLTCSTSAGHPPARLDWYRGSEMMDSHYTVEGDTVSAIITFVPSQKDEEQWTCEASNDALSEPMRNTITIEVAHTTTVATTRITTTTTSTRTATTTTTPWLRLIEYTSEIIESSPSTMIYPEYSEIIESSPSTMIYPEYSSPDAIKDIQHIPEIIESSPSKMIVEDNILNDTTEKHIDVSSIFMKWGSSPDDINDIQDGQKPLKEYDDIIRISEEEKSVTYAISNHKSGMNEETQESNTYRQEVASSASQKTSSTRETKKDRGEMDKYKRDSNRSNIYSLSSKTGLACAIIICLLGRQ